MTRVRPKTITLDTDLYGTLQLRFGLSVGHISSLASAMDDLSARELTVLVVELVIISPQFGTDEIRSWDDELLARVALTWAEEGAGHKWRIPDDVPPFEAFQNGCRAYLEDINRNIHQALMSIKLPQVIELGTGLSQLSQQVTDIGQQFQSIAKNITESIMEPLRQFHERIAESLLVSVEIQVGAFFQNLPDPAELAELLQAYQSAMHALEQGGYPFVHPDWSPSAFAEAVAASKVNARVRSAVITNRLLAHTRKKEFESDLRQSFERPSVLSRRWTILQKALAVHLRRDYEVSIPTLLAQVEGIFTDALILKSMVLRVDGSLCARDAQGKPKLGRNGKLIRLRGLGQKVQNSDLRNEDTLRVFSEFFTNSLIRERNDILHGRELAYGKAKLSVQLLFIIDRLAREFAHFTDET